ncbi:MAG: Fe-S protein assembly co-chaperone HscB [Blastocatellia bacterium]|nr:Fe-S protein assembly co-chaperone HscB [Blastocatellia bacterium]
MQEARLLEKKCWYCTTTTDEHFCLSCDRIQMVDLSTNYFSFFKLPIKYHLDTNNLEAKFYELNRRFHPDFFSQASEVERRYSLDRTSMLNDAYRILKDPIKRANYLLTLQGFQPKKAQTPPDLLEEIFELNEQIEDLRNAKKARDKNQTSLLKNQVLATEEMLNEREEVLNNQLKQVFQKWDNLSDEVSIVEKQQILAKASDLLAQMKYINNLINDIDEEFND